MLQRCVARSSTPWNKGAAGLENFVFGPSDLSLVKNKGGRPPGPFPGSASIISNIIGKVRSPSAPGKVQCLRQKGKNSDAIKDAKGERARESKRAQSLVCHSPSKKKFAVSSYRWSDARLWMFRTQDKPTKLWELHILRDRIGVGLVKLKVLTKVCGFTFGSILLHLISKRIKDLPTPRTIITKTTV